MIWSSNPFQLWPPSLWGGPLLRGHKGHLAAPFMLRRWLGKCYFWLPLPQVQTHTHIASAVMSVGCIGNARILGRAECQTGLSTPILSSFCPRGLAGECLMLHA